MAERFIKFIPSERSEWLLINYPNAFLLLTVIAVRARRTLNHPDGNEIGTAHIGWQDSGLTEQQYRTAKQKLVDFGIIKILETNRTRKKSTTGTTTKATMIKLIDLGIYDINPETENDWNNDRATTEQRQTRMNKKEEEEKEKIKKEKIEKIAFRENVFMTQDEYNALLSLHGESLLSQMLDILDSYKGSSGKKYKSDYHTMKQGGWVVNKALESAKSHKPISNREKGENILKQYQLPSAFRVEFLNECVEFSRTDHPIASYLRYDEHGFEEQFHNRLSKHQCFKKSNQNLNAV